MLNYKLANAGAHQITVTNTATALSDLLKTAAGADNSLPAFIDAADLHAEDGDFRYLQDLAPTATVGMLVKQGSTIRLRNISLKSLYLIRTSGNVKVNVTVGQSEVGESTTMSNPDVAIVAGDIEIGAVELKNASTDDRANITAANTARSATDKVLLVQNIDAAGNVGSGGYAEDTAHSSGDKGTMMLAVRRDTAASSSGTDGDYSTVNTDVLGHTWVREGYAPLAEDNVNGLVAVATTPLAVSTYSQTLFQNLGANATLNVKATPGNVYSFKMHNTTAATRYMQIFNTATVPSAGNVPLYVEVVPANSSVTLTVHDFGSNGLHCSTGIAFACSTTEATYTAATATDHITHIMYK